MQIDIFFCKTLKQVMANIEYKLTKRLIVVIHWTYLKAIFHDAHRTETIELYKMICNFLITGCQGFIYLFF